MSNILDPLTENLAITLIITHKLICEGAMTGFNPLDGNWAEKLFANNAAITYTLKRLYNDHPDFHNKLKEAGLDTKSILTFLNNLL